MMKAIEGLQTVNIPIGGIYASLRPVAIRTILGSCVSACLYDPVLGAGGMNHYMLPYPSEGDQQEPARYGVHAMELLIGRILKLGAARSRLRAKVFGGANVLGGRQPSPNVAERNAAFAREFLEQQKIPIVGWRVGGLEALEVVFLPATARTFVKPLPALAGGRLIAVEARYELGPE
jgi:chemotaxis receptor (MCP) glutamine deamidase CheD